MRDVTESPQRVSSSTDAATHTVISARPGSPPHIAGVVQMVLSVACSSACRRTARLFPCYREGPEEERSKDAPGGRRRKCSPCCRAGQVLGRASWPALLEIAADR